MKNKVKFIVLPLFLIMLLFIAINCNKPSSKANVTKSNVILIVSDTLRVDVLGCYGGEAYTPNLDWLAENGVRFMNAYSTAPGTMPSSISMFTGNYAKCYKAIFNEAYKKGNKERSYIRVPEKHVIFGETFNKSGYDTKMSYENSYLKLGNLIQGFSLFKAKDVEKNKIVQVNQELSLQKDFKDYFDKRYINNYDMLHYILNTQDNKNFFIVKWYVDPHRPYDPPQKYLKKLDLAKSADYVNEEEKHKAIERKRYVLEVESIDERVGHIIKALRKKNLMDNTIIVFTSDHGECLGEPGKGWNHSRRFWQELIHVPLIFYGPGIKKGLVLDNNVSHLDLMPTIAELTKTRHENVLGRSYGPLLFGKNISKRIVFCDAIDNQTEASTVNDYAIIDNDLKFWKSFNKESKLFNLIDDPFESNNLIGAQAVVVQNMEDKAKVILEEIYKIKKAFSLDYNKSSENKGPDQETIQNLKALGYL